MKYFDADKLIAEIDKRLSIFERGIAYDCWAACKKIVESLQQEQPDEQPEYGYLYTEYIHGKKPRWNVGDVLAHYICTSNEEGEYPLGKIVNVEFDEEDGWVYTFEDESMCDEKSLVEEEAYKKNKNPARTNPGGAV